MPIVTIGTHKGGVGKTNISFHLARYAQEIGNNVLFVDLDVQANSSYMLLGEQYNQVSTDSLVSAALFQKNLDKRQPVQVMTGLALITADSQLHSVERLPIKAASYFSNNLHVLEQSFDLIVIDTPPTMGFAMLAPLMASDSLIAPIIPDQFSIHGIQSMHKKVTNIKTQNNPKLSFSGLIVNQYQARNRLHRETVKGLRQALPELVIGETIAWRSAIANASYAKQPVWHKPRGGAARIAADEMRLAMNAICKRIGIY